MNKQALIELFKSFGRFLWFGILALILTFLTNLVSSGELNDITVVVSGAEINLSFLVLAVLGFVIKAIDRYIHASESNNSNGIAPKFLQS